MEIQSAFNAGVQGLQKANEDANEAAASIAAQVNISAEDYSVGQEANASGRELNSSSGDLSSLNQEIVDLKVAEFQSKSSAQVVQTADETLGTLLDVRV